jgi:periplasmic divalent cation tolerance protein
MNKSADRVLVILVTVANTEEAVRIGKGVLVKRLAACANIIPGARSIFRWKGKVDKAQEVLLILKSTKSRYSALEKLVKSMHTYETPEIIALRVEDGLAQYLGWVRDETRIH